MSTRGESSEVTRHHITFAPLSLLNLPNALRMAKGAFKDDLPLVILTYLWHLLRVNRLPCPFSMVRRRRLWLGFQNMIVGSVDIISTRIHDADTCWVILESAAPIDGNTFGAMLFEVVPQCRLALVQSRHGGWLESIDSIDYVGRLPASRDTFHHIYSLRRERMALESRGAFWLRPRPSPRPDIHTEFHLLRRGGHSIGLSGLYVVEWWPHIGWGGWGALHPDFARLQTAKAALAATEHLARERGYEWLCVETSGSREFRVARRLYEYCGMQQLLTVNDFFQNTHPKPRVTYLVYGKRITRD